MILDLGPATRGHALILPKAHYRNLLEIPEELAGKAMILARKIVAAGKKALHCDGYNVVQNNGGGGRTDSVPFSHASDPPL